MQKWRRFFFLTVVVHFGLTVFTGLLWSGLLSAVEHHRTPALLHAMYASFWLFVPFCQPIFWPLSDWLSGHFSILPGLRWQYIELLAVACINSLTASILLLGFARILRISQRQWRRLPLNT